VPSFQDIIDSNTSITTAICLDQSIASILSCNDLCRQHNIKFIGALARGVCSVIVTDFIDHNITDVDGESRKEIPLLSASWVKDKEGKVGASGNFHIKLTCIDEDRFVDLGISDTAEISMTLPDPSKSINLSPDIEDAHFELPKESMSGQEVVIVDIVNMVNPKTVIVSVADKTTAQTIINSFTKIDPTSDSTSTVSSEPTAQSSTRLRVSLKKCPIHMSH
jgi:hypothetical protein